jgi:pimeloyl-ACP methyl ester carboxylesterase
MVSWLRRTDHHTVHAHIGWNLWCGELTVGRLAQRLEDLVAARGQRAVIVGHSRGGHFARVLAVRRPDLVRGVVTLGTPDLALEAIHPVLRLPAQGLGLVGRAGVPRLFGPSCFNGSCCEQFRADLAGPLPARVAFTSVIGRRDGLVDPAWFGDSGARVVAVQASHIGLIVNADAYTAIAEFLAENPVRPRRAVPALTEAA